MALDTTAGGANSDSYGTIVEASAYFDLTWYKTTWDAFSTTVQENWLKLAAIAMDRYRYKGSRYNGDDQNLAFPRINTLLYSLAKFWQLKYTQFDDDRETALGEIPVDVKRAQFEMVIYLQTKQSTSDGQIETDKEIAEISAVQNLIDIKYARGSVSPMRSKIISGGNLEAVERLLYPWLIGQNAVPVRREFL